MIRRFDRNEGSAELIDRGDSAQFGPAFACAVIVVGSSAAALVDDLVAELAANPRWRAHPAPLLMWQVEQSGREQRGTGAQSSSQPIASAAHDWGRRLGLRAVIDGAPLEPGARYFVPPRQRVWFEGPAVRVAARSSAEERPIDRLLLSIAERWGERSICIVALASTDDGECGLRILRAAGATVLQRSALLRAKTLRAPQLSSGPSSSSPASSSPASSGPDSSVPNDSSTPSASSIPSDADGESSSHRPQPPDGEAASSSQYPGGPDSSRLPSSRVSRVFSVPLHVLAGARLACERAVQGARERGRVRVWMPGCKAGGMTYAVAMLLSEAAASCPPPPRLMIFATDDDEYALSIARAGSYPARAALGMDPGLRGLYTFDEGERIRVAESLREVCVFSRHELLRNAPMARIDFVVCQRVFEGLSAARRAQLIEGFHYSLRHGGVLLAFDHLDEFPDALFERIEGNVFRARPKGARWRSNKGAAAPLDPERWLLRDGWRARGPHGGSTRREALPVDALPVESLSIDSLSIDALPVNALLPGLALPLIVCDAELTVSFISKKAQIAFKLAAEDAGFPLLALAGRLPGGLELLHAARQAVAKSSTEELTIRAGRRTYLAHITEAAFPMRPGIVILFTDVTQLELARAQSIAQQHQFAAVARVGELAAGGAAPGALYEEALASLFGNISACSAGVIVEVTGHARKYAVVASRNLGADPLSTLCRFEDAAFIIDAVVARGCIVSQTGDRATWLRSGSNLPISARARRARGSLGAGLACPILVDGLVFGVVALYGRDSAIDDTQHRRFAQAIADLLGSALARYRARLRLTLERDVSRVLASASDVTAAGEGLERALAELVSISTVEIWAASAEGMGGWGRVFPARAAPCPWPEGLVTSNSGPCLNPAAEQGELLIPIGAPDLPIHVLRLCGQSASLANIGLVEGFERVGSMLAEFLERLQILARSRTSEAAFRQKSSELEALYSTLPVGISIHDRQGLIRHVNEHLARVMEPPATAGADPLQRLYRDEIPGWIERVLRSGEPSHDVELFVTAPEGMQWWLCNFGPIREFGGAIHGASAVIQDITPLKRVEASLREADQQKDDFLALLGHELRNPMAAIRNATELLSRIEHRSPQLARLQSIFDRQTLQTTKLIDGLLDIARVARGKVDLQLEPLEVADLVRQVVDDRRQQFNDRVLELHLADGELWVMADRVRLVQVLDNLISNALKFTFAGGHIGIELRRSATDAQGGSLRVHDDGMGIEAELLPRIFEPFRQGHLTRAQSQGLGLGLALVKGLADLHGFALDAHSGGPGRGASFEVHFALIAAPESLPPESYVDRGGLDLLLVEDDPDISETLSELLEAAGHRILAVGSAEQALASLRHRRPAVILCDIGLPGMDGLEFAARLRADPELCALKLVALTGFGDSSSQSRIERAGFDRQLIKPVRLEALQNCLARVAPRIPGQVSSSG